MKGNTIWRIVIVAAILIFCGHQIYASVYKPISTESVNYYEAVDGLNVTGIIMRHETPVSGSMEGVYHYLIGDGSRVAKGGVIANIYSDDNASRTMLEIQELETQIAEMKDLQSYNNQQAADLELVNSRVDDALNRLVRESAAGNYETFSANADSLLGGLNRRLVVTGQAADFTKQIAQLEERLNGIKAGLPTAKGHITAALSGYFSTSTDGFETVLTGEDLSVYTAEYLDEMKPAKVGKNVVGKIVSDYDWYILTKMSINDSMRYKVGEKLDLSTEIQSGQTLEVTVAQINVSKKKDNAVVIFSCSQMSRELASMRSGAMKIINKTYEGLKVPKKALRVVSTKDGPQSGVYVVSGITVHFVPIKMIYSNDEYMICEQEQSNDSVLRLYDEVVVKGKNLYDGKVVG